MGERNMSFMELMAESTLLLLGMKKEKAVAQGGSCTGSDIALNTSAMRKTLGLQEPSKTPSYFCIDGGVDYNYSTYYAQNGQRRIEVAPGSWMWGRDLEAEKEEQKACQAQVDQINALWVALQTRILTEDEMREVLRLGDQINNAALYYGWHGPGSSFQSSSESVHHRAMERMQAYYNQARLQLIAKGAVWPTL